MQEDLTQSGFCKQGHISAPPTKVPVGGPSAHRFKNLGQLARSRSNFEDCWWLEPISYPLIRVHGLNARVLEIHKGR